MTWAKVLTANRLLSGDVVFYASNPGWVDDLSKATIANSSDEIAALESVARQAQSQGAVIGPYLIDLGAQPLAPHRTRERIRVSGPTVRPDPARRPADRAREKSHVPV